VSFLRQYLVAVRFFTRMPVSGDWAQGVVLTPELLRASAAHFPGVGWLVGLLACVAFALVEVVLPAAPYVPLAAAVACTMVTVLLTGAFHEDGLAHLAYGLGATVDADESIELMNDSRIGSHGALALLLVISGKITLLAVLAAQSPSAVLAALLAGHVVSRFWPLVVMHKLACVDEPNTANNLDVAVDVKALGVAAAWCIAPLGVALLVQGPALPILGLLFSGAALFSMHALLSRRLKGFTVDGVGATQQVCELAFYFGAAVGLAIS
jgi:adenosylcobinamide-GDP ribazoletransferase